MNDSETKRLSRLVALLTLLQTKRLITAAELADRFAVSTRTIYRDMRALENAGVPILTHEGKGYGLLEGYRLPPLTFTEQEANALSKFIPLPNPMEEALTCLPYKVL